MEPFVAMPSRGRIALLTLGSIAFVFLSLWFAGAFGPPPRPGREWIGWVGAVFFALMAVAWAMRLRETGPQILIDEAGLTWRHWSDEHIPWSAVEAVGEGRIRRQIFFSVQLADPAAHPPTRLLGKVSAAQGGLGAGHFSLNATGTDRSHAELRDAMIRFGRLG